MNLSFKTHLKNTSIVLRTVMSAGALYSCATYNVQKGKNLFEVKDSEIKSLQIQILLLEEKLMSCCLASNIHMAYIV